MEKWISALFYAGIAVGLFFIYVATSSNAIFYAATLLLLTSFSISILHMIRAEKESKTSAFLWLFITGFFAIIATFLSLLMSTSEG
ncbi:MAG: hypothetical protein IJV27_07425 [Prevotella sp.]|nr:hypothetical protein [Prevotella sp.]